MYDALFKHFLEAPQRFHTLEPFLSRILIQHFAPLRRILFQRHLSSGHRSFGSYSWLRHRTVRRGFILAPPINHRRFPGGLGGSRKVRRMAPRGLPTGSPPGVLEAMSTYLPAADGASRAAVPPTVVVYTHPTQPTNKRPNL